MNTKTFYLKVETEKEFDVSLSGFVESSTLLFPIVGNFEMSFSPSLTVFPIANMLLSWITGITPARIVTGTTVNISAGAGDCWGDVSSSFSSTGDAINIGNNAYLTDPSLGRAKAWIPFIVNLASMTILSATIYVVASQDRLMGQVRLKVGCEASDNPSTPTNWNDLNSRAITTAALLEANVPIWTTGNTYSFDVTSSVQEILNYSWWDSGDVLSILFTDWGTRGGDVHDLGAVNRVFASTENTTYTEPILRIIY